MYRLYRFHLPILLSVAFFLPAAVFGYYNENVRPPGVDTLHVDWTAAADSSSQALIGQYWNPDRRYFYYGNLGKADFHYWPQAHALDVMTDAYIRTGDTKYLQILKTWYEGVHERNHNSWINDFYDDMEWNALAMLRVYQATDDERFMEAVSILWSEISAGWTDVAGGGIMWSKPTPNSKNAISNSPASILASRLYRQTGDDKYLVWALRTYDWTKRNLFDPSTGAVWDHVLVENGKENIRKDWIFTYNQGMFQGAALELYRITGDQHYLEVAIKAADYVLINLTTEDGLLKSEGTGDGGLFKGIFVRYLTQLILEEDIPESTRHRYVAFLTYNAETLWTEGTCKPDVLFDVYWKQPPPCSKEIDLTVQLSGAMMMEAMALLEKNGLLEE